MLDDGSVDFARLYRLIDWHIAAGTDAIVAVGTTGESATLEVKEHLSVIEHTVQYVACRVPVIAGTGANATAEATLLTREAMAMGVDACLLVTPYYNKPTQEGMYRHFGVIADAVDGPLFLYNVPGRTGCDMLPATVERLLSFDNIVGIKEAKGCLQRIRELLAIDPGFVVFSGDDATACESILLGCRGDVSVTANVAPEKMHAMCAAALAGDTERARMLDQELAGLHRDLFLEPNPIPVKWALRRMGLIEAGIRLPLTPMSEAYVAPLEQAMLQAGVEF